MREGKEAERDSLCVGEGKVERSDTEHHSTGYKEEMKKPWPNSSYTQIHLEVCK